MSDAERESGRLSVAFVYHDRLYHLDGQDLHDGALLWQGLEAREGHDSAVRLLRERLDLAGHFLDAPPAPSEARIAASPQAGPLLVTCMAALVCARINVHPDIDPPA